MSVRTLPRSPDRPVDVVVIGGGPGGAAVAARAAQEGLSTVVVERRVFPRFHIGESMLTYTAKVIEKLGFAKCVEEGGFTTKTGAEFTRDDGSFTRVDFTAQGGGRRETTYQVERADFDKMFLDHARECGAKVLEDTRVRSILAHGGTPSGITMTTPDGRHHTVHARYVVDASGRAGVLAHQHLGSRIPNPRLEKVAAFRHYDGVTEDTNPGAPGDIVIGTHADGWVWSIPIRPGMLSVGVVTDADNLKGVAVESLFDDHVGRIPRIAARTGDASPSGRLRTESGFSYWNEQVAGPGYFVIGDAGCFVDPVFSAGVYLATITGIRAAESIARILNGLEREDTVQREYTRFYKTGYDTYFRLIYGFYAFDFSLGRLLKSTGTWVSEEALTRLLGGDFWTADNALAASLRQRPEYDTFASFEPLFGCPVYSPDDLDNTAGTGKRYIAEAVRR